MNKKKALCIVWYCILVFLFFEGLARLLLLKTPILDTRIFPCDAAYRLELVRHYYQKSIMFNGPHSMYHPVRGWALRPNVAENSIHTNSKGLRGEAEYAYEKPPTKSRIAVLGDSFTFGDEVSDKETYPYYLGQMLPGSEVLNFGVNGYGHDQMLLYLQEGVLKCHPDIVILGFVPMDMGRNMLAYMHYPKPRFELVGRKLVLKNVPVPLVSAILQQEVYRLKIFDLVSTLYTKYWMDKKQYSSRKTRITEAILDEMVKDIRGCGAKPLFVYIVTPEHVKDIDQGHAMAMEDFLFRFCKTRKISCLSTRQAFSNSAQEGVHLKESGHWDAWGNRAIAGKIKEYLFKKMMK